MFTGIVQGKATVRSIAPRGDVVTMTFEFPPGALAHVSIGASVSLAGCCLTVTATAQNEATFDLVPETLRRTSLGSASIGSHINFERSLRFGDEVGGHILSGHVDVVATVSSIEVLGNSRVVTFATDRAWMKYLFEKGYIALNGASLTLTRVNKETGEFCVSLIPETLSKTTFGESVVGDVVNVEVDRTTQVIVDTVERLKMEGQLGL